MPHRGVGPNTTRLPSKVLDIRTPHQRTTVGIRHHLDLTGIMGKQLSLHVTIQVAPHDVDAFLEALRPCWEGCVSEKENLFFDVFQDPETPGLFRFVELWSEDKEWFYAVQL